jgi:3-oxoacyl-[acyl-carrier protein] reductase
MMVDVKKISGHPNDMNSTAYIALGSNLGDRCGTLDRAIELLRGEHGVSVRRISSYHETAPEGGPPGQDPYLNAAAELETTLQPGELLAALLRTEQSLGRVRRERFGARTLDLDLLLYSDSVIHEDSLTVPHPRMHERRFVLVPLVEIAPHVRHPVMGSTMQELLRTLRPHPGRGELSGLRALVTGSSSGIGRAIALALSEGGADVIVHRRGERGGAEAVAQEIQAHGVKSAVLLADLQERDACFQLVDGAWQLWNGLDIWINNAGADTLTGPAATWTFEEKLEQLLAVDLKATITCARAIGIKMQTQGSGLILNIGWDQAETGMEGDSGQMFAAVKGGVMSFTRSLALSLAPHVRVNCLAPGWIRTAWGQKASEVWQERVARETPLARWGTPEDVAAAARWLVSPSAAYIPGQTIRINGGAVR